MLQLERLGCSLTCRIATAVTPISVARDFYLPLNNFPAQKTAATILSFPRPRTAVIFFSGALNKKATTPSALVQKVVIWFGSLSKKVWLLNGASFVLRMALTKPAHLRPEMPN